MEGGYLAALRVNIWKVLATKGHWLGDQMGQQWKGQADGLNREAALMRCVGLSQSKGSPPPKHDLSQWEITHFTHSVYNLLWSGQLHNEEVIREVIPLHAHTHTHTGASLKPKCHMKWKDPCTP